MKTTYNYKNKKPEGVDENKESNSIADTYLLLRKESEKLKESQEEAILNGTDVDSKPSAPEEKIKQPTPSKPKEPEKKKGKGSMIAIVVIIAIVGVAGYKLFQNKQAEKAEQEAMLAEQEFEEEMEESVADFEGVLNTMFTDETATDVKPLSEDDFNLLRSKATELEDSYNVDIADYSSLIDNAEQFLKDKAVITELSDQSIYFGSAEFNEKLNGLVSSTESYYSSSLKEGIATQLAEIKEASDLYTSMRNTMMGGSIEGISAEAINSLGKSLNIQELTELYKLTQKGIEVSQLQQELSEAESKLYDENGNEIKVSKSEKAEYQSAIDSAKDAYEKAVSEEEELRVGWEYLSNQIYGASAVQQQPTEDAGIGEPLED